MESQNKLYYWNVAIYKWCMESGRDLNASIAIQLLQLYNGVALLQLQCLRICDDIYLPSSNHNFVQNNV
jgi:hypothetical protein